MIARVAILFEDHDPGEIRRWAIAGAIVVVLHFILLCPYVYFYTPEEIGDNTSPISLDLTPSNDTVDQAEVLPTPETPPPQEQPPPEPQPPPPPPQPQAIVETPPPLPPKVEEQQQQAAPQEARTKGGAPPVPPAWISAVTRRLEHFKRVPSKAITKSVLVQVGFTVDRSGHVLSHEIEKSSGRRDLDDEAASVIERAQPLPPFPGSMAGNAIHLTVPVSFEPSS